MRPSRILVVDDEVSARLALAALLREEAFDIETAKHGLDALDKLVTFFPQVVVTDLEMPGMDGVELVARVRDVGDPPSVIVMTSYGERARAVAALRAGAADYVSKPICFDELLLVVRKAIRLHELEREVDRLRGRELLSALRGEPRNAQKLP